MSESKRLRTSVAGIPFVSLLTLLALTSACFARGMHVGRFQALVREDARTRKELLAVEQDLRRATRQLRAAEDSLQQVGAGGGG